MKLTLGLSPCPNDTFIFDALINNKIDTEGLDFEVTFADIEQLNKWAFSARLDITKLSFSAFEECISKYVLLDSGSALGTGCGPLLIKKPETHFDASSKIAIPGKHTTANQLLNMAHPNYLNRHEVLFSNIENEILLDNYAAGLVIHESRFTFHKKGLVKLVDLGQFWEEKTHLPIPLGGIVIRRVLPRDIQKKVERVLRKSVEFAFLNRKSPMDFVKYHAQEIDADVINSHIALYVNKYTLSLGEEGREAVSLFCTKLKKSEFPTFL